MTILERANQPFSERESEDYKKFVKDSRQLKGLNPGTWLDDVERSIVKLVADGSHERAALLQSVLAIMGSGLERAAIRSMDSMMKADMIIQMGRNN